MLVPKAVVGDKRGTLYAARWISGTTTWSVCLMIDGDSSVPGSYLLPCIMIIPLCSTTWKELDDPPALLLFAASKAFSLSALNSSKIALCSDVSVEASSSVSFFWWRRLQSSILARTRAANR